MIFGVRTVIGQEKVVAEILENKTKLEGLAIPSIALIDGLKGYLVIEAENEGEIKKLTYKAPNIRGLVKGQLQIQELDHFFEVKAMTSGFARGDTVELTSGAFKGEKARIIRVDEGKEKITVEIIESAVPIPITVDASQVRLIEKQDKEEAKETTGAKV
ncbi:MAG: transcription elongation factor Spt5 [DPANN group archaeon]|nr:transcription elongation factor Spt5 [DPANN group archaeon]